MKKVCIILAEGFEESESMTIVDILRRAHIHCDMVGFNEYVIGGHGILVKCDEILSQETSQYDMIILPGGYPGVTHLLESKELTDVLVTMNNNNKYICAMCAAPLVLEQAGLLKGKNYTAYIGYDQKIKEGTYVHQLVVKDGRLITSQGPATTYEFSYALVDELGGDSSVLKEKMLYNLIK